MKYTTAVTTILHYCKNSTQNSTNTEKKTEHCTT